jgi:hypothetical protein
MNKLRLWILPILAMSMMFSCSSSKDLAQMESDYKRAKKQQLETQSDLDRCMEKNENYLAELSEMKGSVQDVYNLNQELKYTQEQLANMTQQMQAASDDFGVWYRVQIGAYEDRSIDSDLETTEGLSLEGDDDLQKVVLGRFRTYEKAKRLQDHLKTMGVADAWIVTYKDGERVPIESVRQD